MFFSVEFSSKINASSVTNDVSSIDWLMNVLVSIDKLSKMQAQNNAAQIVSIINISIQIVLDVNVAVAVQYSSTASNFYWWLHIIQSENEYVYKF